MNQYRLVKKKYLLLEINDLRLLDFESSLIN
jgi:hypothetical protein